jgi:hypothetical protein
MDIVAVAKIFRRLSQHEKLARLRSEKAHSLKPERLAMLTRYL